MKFQNEDKPEASCCFSVQSFALESQGLIPETIVTMGAHPESESPSTPTLVLNHATLGVVPHDTSEMRSRANSDAATFTTAGGLSFRTSREDFGSLHLTNSPGVINMSLDETSVFSCETFKTAQEPPLEVLLALGLLIDTTPPSDPVLGTTELSADIKLPTCTPRESTDERPICQEFEAADFSSPTARSVSAPLFNISFIRDVGKVCIIGSRINFVTNILYCEDKVWAGLHTLHIKSDPSAFHDSYERQKRVHCQMKAMRRWGSQLMITSSTTPGEFPLSVPRIKTRDLEEVVKDVFTWLYAASSPISIMWLYDAGDDGNSRTDLIAQFLANFLGKRRDLTASYFYTKPGQLHVPSQEVEEVTESIIPTLALQLARRIPELEAHIAWTTVNDPWIFKLSLDEQMEKLLVNPLQAASYICEGKSHEFPKLFLIHSLEDCEDAVFQELFLRAFGKTLTLLQKSCIPQRLMLLGRHTSHIQDCFSTAGLHEIVRFCPLPISQDVDTA